MRSCADAGAAVEPDDEAVAARGFAFTAAVLVTLFAAAVLTQVPGGGGGGGDASALLWPTSWGFYAGAAHQEYVVAYRVEGKAVRRLSHPIADPENHWGLGRSAYADVIRLLDLAAAVPSDSWRPCAVERIGLCAAVIARAPVTATHTVRGGLSGPVVLAVERPAHPRDGAARHVIRVAVLDLTTPR